MNRVEDADRAEIACEREVFAFKIGFGRRDRLQIRSPGAADGLETAGDIYPCIELLGFEQAVVGGVEVFAFDVKTGKRETLACGFFDVFVGRADFA